MVAPYGRWAYDNPKYLILNLALGGGYPRGVNGTKGPPYVGLPDSTVQKIRADSAAVLVDWVRVTPLGDRKALDAQRQIQVVRLDGTHRQRRRVRTGRRFTPARQLENLRRPAVDILRLLRTAG